MFHRALILEISHAVEVPHIVEYKLPVLHTDEGAAACAAIAFIDQVVEAEARKARGLNPVKGRRVATLLEVSQDSRTHIENVPPFLLKE